MFKNSDAMEEIYLTLKCGSLSKKAANLCNDVNKIQALLAKNNPEPNDTEVEIMSYLCEISSNLTTMEEGFREVSRDYGSMLQDAGFFEE